MLLQMTYPFPVLGYTPVRENLHARLYLASPVRYQWSSAQSGRLWPRLVRDGQHLAGGRRPHRDRGYRRHRGRCVTLGREEELERAPPARPAHRERQGLDVAPGRVASGHQGQRGGHRWGRRGCWDGRCGFNDKEDRKDKLTYSWKLTSGDSQFAPHLTSH